MLNSEYEIDMMLLEYWDECPFGYGCFGAVHLHHTQKNQLYVNFKKFETKQLFTVEYVPVLDDLSRDRYNAESCHHKPTVSLQLSYQVFENDCKLP